jgi:hypothetical protein
MFRKKIFESCDHSVVRFAKKLPMEQNPLFDIVGKAIELLNGRS